MAAVITLAEAKRQLKIRDTDHDLEVQAALTDADAVIRAYLNDMNDEAWTDTTAPAPVKRATLLLTSQLYDNPGDAGMAEYEETWSAIRSVLASWGRTPTLA